MHLISFSLAFITTLSKSRFSPGAYLVFSRFLQGFYFAFFFFARHFSPSSFIFFSRVSLFRRYCGLRGPFSTFVSAPLRLFPRFTAFSSPSSDKLVFA